MESVQCDGIAAIVSRVPRGMYGDTALAERLKDRAWLSDRVERHNDVLLKCLDLGAVAPCRFGMRLLKRQDVIDAIARYRHPLEAALRRLEGRVEWSVKAHIDSPLRGGARTAAAADGAAYLLGRVHERSTQRKVAQEGQSIAGKIVAALLPLVEELRHLSLSGLRPDVGRLLILNVACLVRRDKVPSLRAKLQDLRKSKLGSRLALTSSGPWPPYSFSGDVLSREASISERPVRAAEARSRPPGSTSRTSRPATG